ncbi:MAG: Asp-tRNA(Asn)/Glu-tRNA(Gln) amidotransferase subunit GatB [Promethearchaeota archaeon]|nr:MAG: Asp-tRNA(Asn)/Glu-tRNA(Gln) amidotransferase subunit GatB [Candidatus Lokiarchaeota archaeon]
MSSKYEDVIIGLEVHIQLTNLKTKLFCSCNNDYRGKEPNTHVCPICLGLPGSLPVVNKNAVEFATRLALALGCDINKSFWFFRKNYFYPDMAKNFQISQYNKAGGRAFADGGKITIKLNSKKKELQLNRIHLEEDPARLVHKGSIATSPYALVDYNRSGVTLIEIVSDPVMNSPEEAREYLKQLKSIVQYTEISDLDLDGSCRVDANISIKGHARSEVKNINSFKEVERALKWEIQRQKNLLKRGKELIQETRHWDDKRRVTIGLRTKEFEKDYRYFPEQDLVPIEITKDFIDQVKKKLPEMPNARAKRFQKDYQLSEFDSEILVLDKDIADFYENGVKSEKSFGPDEYKQYCNWLMGDISRWLNDNNNVIKETKLTPKQLVDLIKLINEGKITGKIAKTFVNEMMKGTPILEIVKKSGKSRIADKDKIIKVVKEVLEENPDIVNDYQKNPKALEALIGKCMKKTDGRLDPEITKRLMQKHITEISAKNSSED